MSTFTYQVLKDTNKISVIKLTGRFTDTTNEANNIRINANTLFGALDANNNLLVTGNTAKPYYGTNAYRMWYSTSPNIVVNVNWDGNVSNPILLISGNGEYNNQSNLPPISNPLDNSANGNIGITTYSVTANSSYSIVLELHKDAAYYNAGQLTEPSSFNYGNYSLTP
jgi:hypothetical protein